MFCFDLYLFFMSIDICEDVEMKRRIVEIKEEIENSRIAKSRELSRRHSSTIRRLSGFMLQLIWVTWFNFLHPIFLEVGRRMMSFKIWYLLHMKWHPWYGHWTENFAIFKGGAYNCIITLIVWDGNITSLLLERKNLPEQQPCLNFWLHIPLAGPSTYWLTYGISATIEHGHFWLQFLLWSDRRLMLDAVSKWRWRNFMSEQLTILCTNWIALPSLNLLILQKRKIFCL